MTLLECIEAAKKIHYVAPQKSFDKFTHDEIIYAALYEALQNEIIVYASIIQCKKYSSIKILYKSILKDYIKDFS
jgi:hypothetical protein